MLKSAPNKNQHFVRCKHVDEHFFGKLVAARANHAQIRLRYLTQYPLSFK